MPAPVPAPTARCGSARLREELLVAKAASAPTRRPRPASPRPGAAAGAPLRSRRKHREPPGESGGGRAGRRTDPRAMPLRADKRPGALGVSARPPRPLPAARQRAQLGLEGSATPTAAVPPNTLGSSPTEATVGHELQPAGEPATVIGNCWHPGNPQAQPPAWELCPQHHAYRRTVSLYSVVLF